MKIAYVIASENCGEVQGIFDAEFKLLDFWSMNDACFRQEYMTRAFTVLGIEFLHPTNEQFDAMAETLEKAAAELWGLDD